MRNETSGTETRLYYSLIKDRAKEIERNPVRVIRKRERLALYSKLRGKPPQAFTSLEELFLYAQLGVQRMVDAMRANRESLSQ
jgi:hypothetical protein